MTCPEGETGRLSRGVGRGLQVRKGHYLRRRDSWLMFSATRDFITQNHGKLHLHAGFCRIAKCLNKFLFLKKNQYMVSLCCASQLIPPMPNYAQNSPIKNSIIHFWHILLKKFIFFTPHIHHCFNSFLYFIFFVTKRFGRQLCCQ